VNELLTGGKPSPRYNGLLAVDLWLAEFLRVGFRTKSRGSPEESHAVYTAVRIGISVDVLRRIRREFPYLAVLFCDGNTDPDIPQRLDLAFVRNHTDILSANSKAFAYGSRKSVNCGIVFLNLMDTFGLEQGLIDDWPPAAYLFLTSRGPFDKEGIATAVRDAPSEVGLVRSLVGKNSILLRLGPDADYYEVISSVKDNFVACGLLRG